MKQNPLDFNRYLIFVAEYRIVMTTSKALLVIFEKKFEESIVS